MFIWFKGCVRVLGSLVKHLFLTCDVTLYSADLFHERVPRYVVTLHTTVIPYAF